MRLFSILVSVAIAGSLPVSGARACGALGTACLPPVVVFPVYTHEGLRIGTVESAVRAPLPLEPSPYTGQPITVVYNDPGRLAGSVSPRLDLVPLPRVARFGTKAVYPRGY